MWLKTSYGLVNTDNFLKIYQDKEYVKGIYGSFKNPVGYFTILRTKNTEKAKETVELIYESLSKEQCTLDNISGAHS